MSRDRVVFFLNGERHEVGPEHAKLMLSDYLREVRSLKGTKVVCAEGDCGACSVLRWFPFGEDYFIAINSCITTTAQMDGSSLVTVDSLGDTGLSPVQEAMVKCHGSQCGYCTPGFVVALSALVEKKIFRNEDGAISEKEAKNALTGNLCRCTGYQPIIDAAKAIPVSACSSLSAKYLNPAIRRELRRIMKQPLLLKSAEFLFYAPKDFAGLKKILTKERGIRFIGAATDLGVQQNKRRTQLTKLMSLHLMEDLYASETKRNRVRVGARVTLAVLRRLTDGTELAKFLDIFASPQIKNVATLVGNVGNASPIADTPPFLLATDATIEAFGPKGKRKIPIDKFFLAYRKTALKAGECITAIEFHLPEKKDHLALYKSSQRKDLDISAVNAAFRMIRGEKNGFRIAFGGVAATPKRFKRVEKFLESSALSPEEEEKAVAMLQEDMQPLSDLRGSAAFRRVLAGNFLRQFLADCRVAGS